MWITFSSLLLILPSGAITNTGQLLQSRHVNGSRQHLCKQRALPPDVIVVAAPLDQLDAQPVALGLQQARLQRLGL